MRFSSCRWFSFRLNSHLMGKQLNHDDLFKFAYRSQPHCTSWPVFLSSPTLSTNLQSNEGGSLAIHWLVGWPGGVKWEKWKESGRYTTTTWKVLRENVIPDYGNWGQIHIGKASSAALSITRNLIIGSDASICPPGDFCKCFSFSPTTGEHKLLQPGSVGES